MKQAVEQTVALCRLAGWDLTECSFCFNFDIPRAGSRFIGKQKMHGSFRPYESADHCLLLARALSDKGIVFEFSMSEGENGGVGAWVWLTGQEYRDRTFKRGASCEHALFSALASALLPGEVGG